MLIDGLVGGLAKVYINKKIYVWRAVSRLLECGPSDPKVLAKLRENPDTDSIAELAKSLGLQSTWSSYPLIYLMMN